MRSRHVSLTLAALGALAVVVPALVHCGPSLDMTAMANAPGAHLANKLSITIDGKEVSYRGASSDASYDAATHVLTVSVVGDAFGDNDPLMHNECTGFASASGGNYVVLRFKDFDPTKIGKVTATDADYVSLDDPSGAPVTKKTTLSGVTLDIEMNDRNRVRGTLSGGGVEGTIDATSCWPHGDPDAPDAASDAPAAADSATTPADSASAAPIEDAGAPTTKKKKHGKKS